MRVASVGVHARAFSLANGEAAGSGLLCVLLVHFCVFTLENGGVKPAGKDGSKSCDILPGFQFLNAPCVHFCFYEKFRYTKVGEKPEESSDETEIDVSQIPDSDPELPF